MASATFGKKTAHANLVTNALTCTVIQEEPWATKAAWQEQTLIGRDLPPLAEVAALRLHDPEALSMPQLLV